MGGKLGRIGSGDWMSKRADSAIAVYNSDYTANGVKRHANLYSKPWVAIGPPGIWKFQTHAEALAWAFEKAEEAL